MCDICSETHVDKPVVLEWALFAVSQLCFDDADTNRVSIATEGGISLILQSMKSHSNHPDLQRRACLTFGQLASNNNANRHIIQEQRGVQLIKHALQSHPNHHGIQEWANWALQRLK